MKTILEKAFEIAENKAKACKNIPACPMCSDKQVQLLTWSHTDSKWKCRGCGHKFFEVVYADY